jgi:hypothetical protein
VSAQKKSAQGNHRRDRRLNQEYCSDASFTTGAELRERRYDSFGRHNVEHDDQHGHDEKSHVGFDFMN